MRDMMMDGGMWGMGAMGWLVVLVLLLAGSYGQFLVTA